MASYALVLADKINIRFPPQAKAVGAAPLSALARRGKISSTTRDTAAGLLENISGIAGRAASARDTSGGPASGGPVPGATETGDITLEMNCSSKKLAVNVVFEHHGCLTLTTARQLQALHPSVVVKPARRKVSFVLPTRL